MFIQRSLALQQRNGSLEMMAAITFLSRWCARLAGGIIACAAFLVAAEVLLRNMFDTVILNSFELSAYAFATALAFGFAHTLVERAHIRIDVLYLWFPMQLRALVDVISMLGMTTLSGIMAFHAWSVVATSLQLGAVSNSTLQMPLAIPQGLWAIGLSWFVFVSLALTIQALGLLLGGQLSRLNQRFGVSRNRP